jgi:2-oxoglutarate ferredoxin oxidoreductase subunit beta
MTQEITKMAPQMPNCWNPDTKPHKFCPGCGHGLVLKVLGEAIDELAKLLIALRS